MPLSFLIAVPFLGAFATLLAMLVSVGPVLLMRKDASVEAAVQRLL